MLPLLRDSFAVGGLGESAFKNAMNDFCSPLHEQMDFVNEARAFETIAQDAEEYEVLRTPHMYRSLCTSKVLVIEKLNGLRLDTVLPSRHEPGREDDSRTLLEGVGFERE